MAATCRHVARGLSSTSPLWKEALKKTPLHEFHVEQGGRMVEFGGWSMPVQYKNLSIIDSHLHTRAAASLFDVSHMLQSRVTGKESVRFIEQLVCTDIGALKPGTGSLTVFTTPTGGIIDDLIVTKVTEEELYIVSNAGRAHVDLPLMQNALFSGVELRPLSPDYSLLALQGPAAVSVLQANVEEDLRQRYFMTSFETRLFGVDCRITRCGYTGEDGFELSVRSEAVVKVARQLLGHPAVELAGLAARDTLRLEAGLCLYGQDMDESRTPIEAGLAWLVSKSRRARADFPGAAAILRQLSEKPSVRRVGLMSSGQILRGGMKLLTPDGAEIGIITSGSPAPSLQRNIAMGYVSTAHAKVGSACQANIRGRATDVEVVKMPFVPAKYFTPPKKAAS